MMPDDFEERLRAAMRRESNRLPFVVRAAEVERRLAEPSRRFPRWLAIAAVPLGTALVIAVLLAAPRPGPITTSRPSTGSCSVSAVTQHGSYREAGGPEAFFEVGDYYAGASWKIFVRWNPAPPATARLSMWATTPAGGEARVDAEVDTPQPLSSVGGTPDLPGAASGAVQPLPSAGCWTLHAAIDGREAGSATINVATERVSLVAPPSCPITQRPDPPFVPPPSFLGTPLTGSGRAFYYGTKDLWTKVNADGSWGGARDATGGYGAKSFWWSDAFKVDTEPQPALQVTGRRLDGPAEAAHSEGATNAAASDIGSAMLTGVTLPTAGCWELTGHYRGHDLSFVVWVPEEPAVPTQPGVPPVASCDARAWPATHVSCTDAQRSVSLGAPVGTGSGGAPLIWLTTLAAVDAEFAPGRQVADHPNDPMTPVWVFIYGERPGDRLLHVADATNSRTRDGAFIYFYTWSELGSPALPATMPSPGLAAGCPQSSMVDPAIGTDGPRAYIRVAEPLQINNAGHADLWARVVPDVEARQLLATGYRVNGQTSSGSTNGQLERITSDQLPSDWKLAGGQFKGSVKFWQSGCWHIRIFLDGRFIGSADVLTSSP